MEKAAAVIKDILQEILVQASEQQVQAVDSETCIRYMNRFMATLDANGIALGYTKIVNINDDVTIPDGALEGLIFGVALRLVTSYDIPPGQFLFINAKDGLSAMRSIAVKIIPSRFPSTLPIGSGNEDNFDDIHFFPELEDAIAGEFGGNIQLEENTNDG